MAITLKDVVGAGGSWSARAGWTYTLKAALEADKGDPKPGPRAVLQATGLAWNDTYKFPLVGTPTETDPTSHLQSVDVSAEEDGRRYSCTIVFGAYDAQQDKGVVDSEGRPDPFSAPPVLRSRGETEEIAAMYDRAGTACLNTAGDPLPGLTAPINITTFQVTRTERTFPRDAIQTMQNRLNASAWQGFEAESLLCRSIEASRQWSADVDSWVWDCTYDFAYKDPIAFDDGGGEVVLVPGWDAVILNAGLRQKVGSERKQILIDGAPVSEPVPLKEDGTMAAPADDPHYLSFPIYTTANFDLFGFPPDLFSAGTPLPETP